jgi:hypothetical protein
MQAAEDDTRMTVLAAPEGLWLRGRTFDTGFILGTAAVALLAGYAVARDNSLFVPVLVLDLWLLGYHHVIATFTQIAFDAASVRQHRFLVLGLPPLVALGTFAIAGVFGLWAVVSLYLYWQWFHYTRQSYGISQAYARKSSRTLDDVGLTKAALYLLPLWGILHRSAQAPAKFLRLEVRVLPIPEMLADAVGVCAVAVLAYWAIGRARAWRAGRLPVAHTLYLLSHFTVFFVGYIAIPSIDYGWLTINIWHNAQYILFVWLANNRRFEGAVHPEHRLLSMISQRRNVALYFVVCLAVTVAVYLAIRSVLTAVTVASVGYMLLIYQSLNFHHYVVDAVIWRGNRRKLARSST